MPYIKGLCYSIYWVYRVYKPIVSWPSSKILSQPHISILQHCATCSQSSTKLDSPTSTSVLVLPILVMEKCIGDGGYDGWGSIWSSAMAINGMEFWFYGLSRSEFQTIISHTLLHTTDTKKCIASLKYFPCLNTANMIICYKIQKKKVNSGEGK